MFEEVSVRNLQMDMFMSKFGIGSAQTITFPLKIGYRAIIQKPYCTTDIVTGSHSYMGGSPNGALIWVRPTAAGCEDVEYEYIGRESWFNFNGDLPVSSVVDYCQGITKSISFKFQPNASLLNSNLPIITGYAKNLTWKRYLMDSAGNYIGVHNPVKFTFTSPFFDVGMTCYENYTTKAFRTEPFQTKALTCQYNIWAELFGLYTTGPATYYEVCASYWDDNGNPGVGNPPDPNLNPNFNSYVTNTGQGRVLTGEIINPFTYDEETNACRPDVAGDCNIREVINFNGAVSKACIKFNNTEFLYECDTLEMCDAFNHYAMYFGNYSVVGGGGNTSQLSYDIFLANLNNAPSVLLGTVTSPEIGTI